MGACPFRGLAVGPALDPRLKRAVAAERGEDAGGARRIVAGRDHVAHAERIGLIFLLAREAQSIEPGAALEHVAHDPGAKDRADDLAEHAQRAAPRISFARMGVVGGDMADLVAEREGELGFVVHQPHQLARDVDIAAGDRESVLDRRVERREVERLAGVGDAGICADAAADRFDVSRARAGLGAAELLDDRRMLALRLGDVLRIEIAEPLRAPPE